MYHRNVGYSGLPNESTGTHPKTWQKMQASTLISTLLEFCRAVLLLGTFCKAVLLAFSDFLHSSTLIRAVLSLGSP